MALPNDSIAITPGTGAAVATHSVSSKEYQAMVVADPTGQLVGSRLTYFYQIPSQVHVAAANAVHWDLFNASSTLIVRVRSVRFIPDIFTVVTGVAFQWKIARTTAVGTGGTAQTAWAPDTTQAALDAAITCRSKPSGGATEGTILNSFTLHSEETNTSTQQMAAMGGLELLPPLLVASLMDERGVMLRQNEGLRMVQINSSIAGNTGWLISFTVE